jgi:hypothetical protein
MFTPINVLTNYLRARTYNKPFYAVDLGLNGGQINGLRINGLIEPTGNTKVVDLVIDTYSDGRKIIKTVEIKEWRCVNEKEMMSPYRLNLLQKDIQEAVTMAKEILNWWNESDGE